MFKIVLGALALVVCLEFHSNAANFELKSIPVTRRIEGRVTLEYVDGERRIKNKLAFTELADPETGRSKVTIGHVSWNPKVYYTRGRTVMTIDNLSNRCMRLLESNRFLPELDFFIKYSYTDQEIEEELSMLRADCHSPIAVLLMHIDKPSKFERAASIRNVVCSMFRSRYKRSKTDTPIKFDIFVPKVSPDKDNRLPLFSVRETAEDLKKGDGFNTFSTIITIDFFYIEAIDKKNPHQLARLEEELTLPLGAGCSEFIQPAEQLGALDYKSFMMSYIKSSNQDLVSLAYDHEFNYLRKEQHGQSVSIWDLNEDLLYHSDKSMAGKIYSNNAEIYSSTCSVIKFEDDFEVRSNLSSGKLETYTTNYISRPYDAPGDSLNVFKFLGFQTVRYMGQATVRDLPAMVFETIVDKPPRVFQLEFQNFAPDSPTESVQYIVQFYVFKTSSDTEATRIKSGDNYAGELPAVSDHYWPARINLYARNKETSPVRLLESLEVQDFHWGLYGWQGKPSELFMMPDCFDDEDEQLRIELSLNMKQTTPMKRQLIFTNYKYKLELDLQSDLFKLFKISRLHLTDYSVSLLRHNLLAKLVISDRREEKKMSYFGEGQLPSEDAYRDHKLVLMTGSAVTSLDGCLMTASHIESVAMALFCPAKGIDPNPTCTVIYGEAEPAIKKLAKPSGESKTQDRCQVYRFEPGEQPKRATQEPDRIKRKLYDYEFHFALADITSPQAQAISKSGNESQQTEIIDMVLDDYDVTSEQQLLSLSNYKFAMPSDPSDRSKVRSFSSMTHDTIGDCLRLCNLDSSCRSYSFCGPSAKVENEARCLLSSLDLRLSQVESQLVQATPSPDKNQISIKEHALITPKSNSTNDREYLLDLQSGCSIHERDFMSMFTRTEEFLRIDRSQAVKFSMASSPTGCARRVTEREDQEVSHLGAMFAYCAGTGTCLSDEDLFGSVGTGQASSVGEEDEIIVSSHELSCQVFRKRYQTYFDVSPMVVKRPSVEVQSDNMDQLMEPIEVSGGLRQIEFSHNTVEECARTCWNSYGHVCVSFDYCAPQVCLINSVGISDAYSKYDAASVEFESRSGCLGYKRNIKWDQLRRDNLLGNHNTLQLAPTRADGKTWKISSFFSSLLTLGLILISFDVGLILGKKINESLEGNAGSANSRSRSAPEFSSTRNLVRNLGGTNTNGPDNGSNNSQRPEVRASVLSKFNFENEIYEAPNSIQMDDLGQRNRSTSATNGSQQETSNQSETPQTTPNLIEPDDSPQPASRRPNYIEVPNLL